PCGVAEKSSIGDLNSHAVGLPNVQCKRTAIACAVNHCSRQKNNGTRPKVMKNLAIAPREDDDSKNASAIMDGPSVINRNSNDGGYLDVFKNESAVWTRFFCCDHFDGSPYASMARMTMKSAVATPPRINNKRRRRWASKR